MAITINIDSDTALDSGTASKRRGKGGSTPLFAAGVRPTKVVFGYFVMDNNYPTGGYDITALFNRFKISNPAAGTFFLDGILVDQPLTGAQTGKFAKIDYANKKIQLFTNASPAVEVAGASDQSAITRLNFWAWGMRK